MAKSRKRRTNRRSRHRGHSRSLLPALIGVLLVLITIAVFGYFFLLYMNQKVNHVSLDKNTYCPIDTTPAEVTVLLVDTTDKLSKIQQSSIENIVEKLVSEIPRYGALAIYTVSTNPDVQSNPVFYRCNPGRGSEINPLVGNPQKVEKSWKDGFKGVLSTELSKTLNTNSADASPIFESIQWITIQQFEKLGNDSVPRSLVMMSDFLQHTSDYSHYTSSLDFQKFENSQYYRKIKANLQNVRVEMWQIRRNSGRQNASLTEFWKTYFRSLGTTNISFNQIPG